MGMTIKNINVERLDALPGSPTADTAYFIKAAGENFGKLFVTNNDGTITATMIGIRPRGAYAGGTAYTTGDMVTDQNSTWISLDDTTGNAPPTLPTESNAYWQLLAKAGADGADGAD